MSSLSRRDFMKLSSGSLTFGVLSQSLAHASTRIGLIGAGKQGLKLLSQLMSTPQIEIGAVCDVAAPALDQALTLMRTAGLAQPYWTQDNRELLSQPDIQAVVIAAPDFSHTPLTLMALEAGKDVYLETPLTRTVQEFTHLQEVARTNGRILYTSDAAAAHPGYAIAAEWVRAGLLGKISRIHIVVNLSPYEALPDWHESQVNWEQFLLHLPSRPFDARLLTRWQDHRECSDGTAVTQLSQALQIVHGVMRVTQPVSIAAQGGVYVWRDGRDNPDTFYAILDYAEGFVVSFSLHPGSRKHDVFTLHGTQGTLDLLNWKIDTADAVKPPTSDAMIHHANEQLSRAAQHGHALSADFVGWLKAMQQRSIPAPVLEHWSRQIQLSQIISKAVHA